MSFFKKAATFATLSLAVFLSNAAEVGVDLTNYLGVATLEETYSLAKSGDYYVFTPKESGTVTVSTNYKGNANNLIYSGNNQSYFIFSEYHDIFLQLVIADYYLVDGVGWNFVFNATKNTNYVIGYTDLMRSGALDFTITSGNVADSPVALTFCYPTPGYTIDTAEGVTGVSLEFDKSVTAVDRVYLCYTDVDGQQQEINIPRGGNGYQFFNKMAEVNLTGANAVYQTARENADFDYPFYLKFDKLRGTGGAVTKVQLNQGRNYVTTDNEGNLSIEYKFMEGAQLVEQHWPEKFYSYWPEGNEDGYAYLTFDSPVTLRGAEVTVTMGHAVRGEEPMPPRVEPNTKADDNIIVPFWNIKPALSDDGKTIILDFTGIEFIDDIFLIKYDEVTVFINAIRSENGMVALMEGHNILDVYIPYVDTPYPEGEDPDNPDQDAGIESIEADSVGSATLYDLHGMRVAEPQKGRIYILNGKKTVLR